MAYRDSGIRDLPYRAREGQRLQKSLVETYHIAVRLHELDIAKLRVAAIDDGTSESHVPVSSA